MFLLKNSIRQNGSFSYRRPTCNVKIITAYPATQPVCTPSLTLPDPVETRIKTLHNIEYCIMDCTDTNPLSPTSSDTNTPTQTTHLNERNTQQYLLHERLTHPLHLILTAFGRSPTFQTPYETPLPSTTKPKWIFSPNAWKPLTSEWHPHRLHNRSHRLNSFQLPSKSFTTRTHTESGQPYMEAATPAGVQTRPDTTLPYPLDRTFSHLNDTTRALTLSRSTITQGYTRTTYTNHIYAPHTRTTYTHWSSFESSLYRWWVSSRASSSSRGLHNPQQREKRGLDGLAAPRRHRLMNSQPP